MPYLRHRGITVAKKFLMMGPVAEGEGGGVGKRGQGVLGGKGRRGSPRRCSVHWQTSDGLERMATEEPCPIVDVLHPDQ